VRGLRRQRADSSERRRARTLDAEESREVCRLRKTNHVTRRPLTPLEVDTIRVALAMLMITPPSSLDLLDARLTLAVTTILNDPAIALLLAELEGADVDVRRPGP
jgi:hypothetical protein